jgi:hypothetical protein
MKDDIAQVTPKVQKRMLKLFAQQLAAVRAQNERRLAALIAGHQAELGQVCVCTTQEQSWTANRDSGLSAVRC